MSPFALLTLSLACAAPPAGDIEVVVTHGEARASFVLTIGSLAEQEALLLGRWKPSEESRAAFERLIPDGRLLTTVVLPASPHSEAPTRALFEALDTDGDGRLSPAELAAAPKVLLDKFDADGDECLTPLELVPDLLTREAVRPAVAPKIEIRVPDKSAESRQVELKGRFASEFADGRLKLIVSGDARHSRLTPRNVPSGLTKGDLDRYHGLASEVVTLIVRPQPPGWFERLDTDGDGQLSVRELHAAAAVLTPADAKGGVPMPDYKSGREVGAILLYGQTPETVIRIARGGLRYGFTKWFGAMDRNADGDISRREFLGSAAQFDALDTDGDGLISLEEAEKVQP